MTEPMDERVARELETLQMQYARLPRSGPGKKYSFETCMLPAADGVRMRTLVFRPEGGGPFPTVVQRSCYAHLEPLYLEHGAAYASRGFVYLCQFCRGTGGSEGKWVPNDFDRADGYAFLQWIEAQVWIGPTGWYGSSYLAFTGWIVADILTPKIKTLYLTHYGTDRFVSAYQRGLFRQDVLTSWAFHNAGAAPEGTYPECASYRPQISVDEDVWRVGVLPWYRAWIMNTGRADAYWSEGFWKLLKDIPSRVKVPVYLGESWYDHHLGSALQTWRDLAPEAKAHSLLRIGAWDHGFQPCVDGQVCDHLENDDARNAYEWFHRILVEGEAPEGGVRCYLTGADRWLDAGSYPFRPRSERVWHLSTAGALEKAPQLSGNRSFRYDPDDPVPSHGAESVLDQIHEAGSRLQPPSGWRMDVVSFLSEPMDEDMDILGPVSAQLSVSSDAEDTAFTAKLMEVFPNGEAYNIRSSIATLSYPTARTLAREVYTPGTVAQIEIDMWDAAWRIHKGSRLRLDISSSDWPQYAAHTNFAGVWSLQGGAKPARQTLFFGAAHDSRLIIPIY
jgi:putative CocE/NonD family hydrolase